jgi:small GTP-binding protein
MKDLLKLNKSGIPVAVIGLPYGGKTTLVNWLKEKRFTRPKPTIGLKFDQVVIGDVTFSIFDISGQESFREEVWKNYAISSAGIIFVLDSSDAQKVEEAKKWFWIMMNEWLKGSYLDKVVLFLANKSDLKKSMNLEDIIEKLELTKMSSLPNISFQIFKTSLRTESNLEYAMKWFFSKVKQNFEIENQEPLAIIISDSIGTPLFIHDPHNLVDDTGMFIGYLKALSGFTDELLGEEKFKVIKVDPHFFFISEEKNVVISIAVEDENSLPEARRLSYLILEVLKHSKWEVRDQRLSSFISDYYQKEKS